MDSKQEGNEKIKEFVGNETFRSLQLNDNLTEKIKVGKCFVLKKCTGKK